MAKLREVEYIGGPACGHKKATKDTIQLIRFETAVRNDIEFYHIYERKFRKSKLCMVYVGVGWRVEE